MADLHDLAAISRAVAADLLLVQGGGGNTSVKSGDGARMHIKASGLRLAEVTAEAGHLAVDLPALVAVVRDTDLRRRPPAEAHAESVRRIQAAVLGESALRPSLETTFHAVLGRLVLHTHPVYANAFTCMVGGQAALAEALAAEPAWVPYAAPGYALGVAVDDYLHTAKNERGAMPETIYLANHGLITHGDEAAAVVAATHRAAEAARRWFGPLPADACDEAAPPTALETWAAGLARTLAAQLATAAVRPARFAALHHAAREPEQWLTGCPLVPDDVVYGGRQVWVAQPNQSPAVWLAAQPGLQPRPAAFSVAVAGLGVVLAGPSDDYLACMEENLLAHVLIRRLIARRGQAQPLPAHEVDYLLNMESEKHRRSVAAEGKG